MAPASRFEEIGGEARLRPIIEAFVDRIFDDIMIGYLFAAADRQRVKHMEYEFAARHLGAGTAYSGKTLPEAHRPHRITGGHFMRRFQILKETLAAFGVAPAISQYWLDHTLALRPQVTLSELDECDPAHPSRTPVTE